MFQLKWHLYNCKSTLNYWAMRSLKTGKAHWTAWIITPAHKHIPQLVVFFRKKKKKKEKTSDPEWQSIYISCVNCTQYVALKMFSHFIKLSPCELQFMKVSLGLTATEWRGGTEKTGEQIISAYRQKDKEEHMKKTKEQHEENSTLQSWQDVGINKKQNRAEKSDI